MTNTKNPPVNPGGLLDFPDERDIRYKDVAQSVPAFDWKTGFNIETKTGLVLPVDDQNGSTSCGGQAVGKYTAVLEALQTGTYEQRSAAYIYNQTVVRDANGTPMGSRLRDNLELAIKQGVALESLCPSYDNGKPPTDKYILRPGLITQAARDSARLAKGASYAYVGTNIDLYAQAIRDNGGMVMLIGGQDNGTWYSAFPKPPTYRQWGHFVYAGKAKLINGKKYIGILNSWGDDTGDDGWQWIGEDWFASGFVESGATIVLDAPVPATYFFTRDLTVGKSGIDVKFLQAFLNDNGFKVAQSGPGSPGQETTYFGTLTRTALAKFQAANGIKPAAGYFGPITRAYINP